MPKFEYRVYHAIDPFRDMIRKLRLNSVTYNDPAYDKGGSFSAEAVATPGQDAQVLREVIEEGIDRHAIYVYRDGGIDWGGPITWSEWRPRENKVLFGAVQWKQWLYDRLLGPDISFNPVREKSYSWNGLDQFEIARRIVTEATFGNGTPEIVFGNETSGIIRDLNPKGTSFRSAGDLIDSMANRDNGFEWEIFCQVFGGGRPRMVFIPYYPERGAFQQGMSLRFKSTQRGGNIILPDSFPITGEQRRGRIWATGVGTPPDQLIAYDEDPELLDNEILIRESVSNYSDVSKIATLASHARAEREFRSVPISAIEVKCSLEDPPVANYRSGDRARLIIQDDFLDIDLPAVRILDREISLSREGQSDEVKLMLSLNDFELPENTTEVNGV